MFLENRRDHKEPDNDQGHQAYQWTQVRSEERNLSHFQPFEATPKPKCPIFRAIGVSSLDHLIGWSKDEVWGLLALGKQLWHALHGAVCATGFPDGHSKNGIQVLYFKLRAGKVAAAACVQARNRDYSKRAHPVCIRHASRIDAQAPRWILGRMC